MPLPRDTLDLVLVPLDHDLVPDPAQVSRVFDTWQQAGLLDAGTGPLRRTAGPQASALVPGGFGVVWLDRPDGMTLYANQLGGFQVRCPRCDQPMALAFSQAVTRWRAGGQDRATCPGCGHRSLVVALPLRPPGAFGRGAVVFADVGGVEAAPRALRELAPAMGPVTVVLRRRS